MSQSTRKREPHESSRFLWFSWRIGGAGSGALHCQLSRKWPTPNDVGTWGWQCDCESREIRHSTFMETIGSSSSAHHRGAWIQRHWRSVHRARRGHQWMANVSFLRSSRLRPSCLSTGIRPWTGSLEIGRSPSLCQSTGFARLRPQALCGNGCLSSQSSRQDRRSISVIDGQLA